MWSSLLHALLLCDFLRTQEQSGDLVESGINVCPLSCHVMIRIAHAKILLAAIKLAVLLGRPLTTGDLLEMTELDLRNSAGSLVQSRLDAILASSSFEVVRAQALESIAHSQLLSKNGQIRIHLKAFVAVSLPIFHPVFILVNTCTLLFKPPRKDYLTQNLAYGPGLRYCQFDLMKHAWRG